MSSHFFTWFKIIGYKWRRNQVCSENNEILYIKKKDKGGKIM